METATKITTVLLVEDQAIIALAEADEIRTLGYEVRTAHNGEQAVEAATTDPSIDLVLMDINLGQGMNGAEAAATILQNRDLPVIFLSSHTERDIVEKTSLITNYGYVTKGAGLTVLDASMRMAMRLFTATRQAKEAHERLRRSETKYRELFENAPIGIFRSDSEGRLLEANSTLARMYGLESSEEAVTYYTDMSERLWVEPEKRNDYLSKLSEDGRVENYEIEEKTADGRRIRVSLNARLSERKEAGTFVIEGFTNDITSMRESEKCLQQGNARLSAMLQAIPDKFVRLGKDGVILDYNSSAEETHLASKVETIGKHYRDVLPPNTSDLYKQKIRETLERHALTTFTYNLDIRERGVRLREARMVPSGEDEVTVLVRDITEEAEKEARLVESEYLFRTAFDSAPIGIVFSDFDSRFIRVNQAYCDMIGYSADELIGRSITEFSLPDDVDITLEAFTRYRNGESGPIRFSKRYIHRDGSIVWAEVNAAIMNDSSGEMKNLFAQIRDITEQKRSEESIRSLVREKEVLLGEVNHRIKNNLQTVASLLSLQAETIEDSPAVEALEDARSRLRTMGILFERFHNAANFNEVSIAGFLSSLTDDIVASNPSTAIVSVVKELEDYLVPAQKLSCAGLVVNELICNAMKYAYHGRDTGNLWVKARRNNGRAVVAVADDGIGLPEGIKIGASGGFGLTVVEALTRQLEGEVTIERGNGTRIEIEFPI